MPQPEQLAEACNADINLDRYIHWYTQSSGDHIGTLRLLTSSLAKIWLRDDTINRGLELDISLSELCDFVENQQPVGPMLDICAAGTPWRTVMCRYKKALRFNIDPYAYVPLREVFTHANSTFLMRAFESKGVDYSIVALLGRKGVSLDDIQILKFGVYFCVYGELELVDKLVAADFSELWRVIARQGDASAFLMIRQLAESKGVSLSFDELAELSKNKLSHDWPSDIEEAVVKRTHESVS